jgi:cytochrome c-type biogenesis protein CcmE
MNRNVLIALGFIAIGIIVFSSVSKDVSNYASFALAEKSENSSKIVGHLAKDKPMVYDPQNAPNEFSFYMKDSEGVIKQVILNKPKPQDFEMSEQIVVTGKMDGNVFKAHEILMKCPSKYKDEEIAVKNKNS